MTFVEYYDREKELEEFQEKITEFINDYKNFPFKLFGEYIKESPRWSDSDCTFGQEELQKMLGNDSFLDQFSISGIEDFRAVINKGDRESKNFIILTDDKSKYMLGHCDDGMFKVLCLFTHKSSKKYKDIGEVIEVKTVNTHSKFRRRRFASAIYKSIISEGTTIMSDSMQYKGAVKLWKDFFKPDEEWKMMIDDKKIKVSLYDINTQKIVSNDVSKMHDNDIWDYDSKDNLRLVAKLS